MAICSILSGLYGHRYCGRRMIANDSGEQYDGGSLEQQEVTHSEFKSNENSSNSSNNEEMRHQKNNPYKEKHQVVSSRWSVLSSSSVAYIYDRYERRVQAVDILSHQHQRRR